MEESDFAVPNGLSSRPLSDSTCAQRFEAALFAGAVLAASLFAFSATGGSVGRVLARIAIVLGCER